MWKIGSLLICLVAQFCLAEEELDWELDFDIKQKSTISDFPLQEIGQEELSNAAIPGALQTTSTYSQNEAGKPAHQQEKESSNKEKVAILEKEKLDEKLDPNNLLPRAEPPVQAITFPEQIYKAPDGRTYGHLETFTVERD